MVIDKNGINGETFFQGILQDLRPRDVLLLSVDNTTKKHTKPSCKTTRYQNCVYKYPEAEH